MERVSVPVRQPKQERSRLSFDRAIDAALGLMAERRSEAFTLAEVAERAGVSIGSIYGRVDSKDDLIRVVFEREMDRIAREQSAAFQEPATDDETVEEAVATTIRIMAEFLRDNASVFAPFMILGNRDAQIARRGKVHFAEMVDDYMLRLLRRREQILHPNPERAVRWSHTVVFSVLARWLGLGSEPEAAGEGDWEQVINDLSEMVISFLTLEGKRA